MKIVSLNIKIAPVRGLSTTSHQKGQPMERPQPSSYEGEPQGPLIRTLKLPTEEFAHALTIGVNVALDEDAPITIVGMADGLVKVCDGTCCLNEPDAVYVWPDVIVTEAEANRQPIPEGYLACREDGRSALVFANVIWEVRSE
jgi:hypothetical protein